MDAGSIRAASTSAGAAPDSVSSYTWFDSRPEDSHGYLDAVVIEAIQAALRGSDGAAGARRVFDAGCGNGALLQRLHGIGYHVAGCELDASGVALARRSLGDAARVEQLSVYDDLAAAFGSQWDVVVATEVIEHLYAPRLFLQRAKALLAPGGSLVLSTPYHGYLKNLALAASGALDAHFTALWDGGHIKFWSSRTLTTLLGEAGLRVSGFRGAGRLPGLWKSMVVTSTTRGQVR